MRSHRLLFGGAGRCCPTLATVTPRRRFGSTRPLRLTRPASALARMRSLCLQVGSRTIEATLPRSRSGAPSERPLKNTAPNFQSGGAAGQNARSRGLGVSRAAAIDDVAYQDPRTAPSRVPDGCPLSDAIWGPPAPLGRRKRGGWKRGVRRARPSRDLRDGTRSRIKRRHRRDRSRGAEARFSRGRAFRVWKLTGN